MQQHFLSPLPLGRNLPRAIAWTLVVVAACSFGISPAPAATYYWDTSFNTAGLGVGGTNDWTASNLWSTSSTGAAGTNLTWSNGNAAIFNGNGTVDVTVNSAISATGGNAVLIGNAPANGTSTTVNFSGSNTLTLTSGYFGVGWQTSGGANTATVVFNQSGGTINATASGIEIGRFGTNATYNLSNGTVNYAGILRVANNHNNANSGTVDPVATLNITGGTFQTSGTSTALIGNAASGRTATATVNVSGTGVFAVDTLQLAGSVGTATATINLNGGDLYATTITKGAGGTGTFNFNGGELYARGDNAAYMSGLTRANVRDGGAIINTDGFDIKIAQALLHSNLGGDAATDGGLTKNGAGTLILTGANTYTGATTVNAGTLQIGDNSAGVLTASNTSVAANAVLRFKTTSYNGGTTYNGNITGAGDIIIDGASATSLMRFAGNNSGFTGTFTVLAGARGSLHAANAGSTAARFVVDGTLSGQAANGSTYHFGELSGASTGLVGGGGVTTNVNWSVGALNTNSTFHGSLQSIGGGLTKVGSGTLTLTGTNTYTGATTINAGTLSVSNVDVNGNNSQLGAGTSLVFGGGTLAFTAAGADSTNRTVTINSGGAGVNVTSAVGELTLTGVLSGAGGLTKSGAGTLLLTGSNNYAGTTTVSGGTLLLNGALTGAGGAITVNSGGKLGGSGSTTRAVNINAGGTLSPGNSPDQIFTGALTLAPSSIYAIEILGPNIGNGVTGYDQTVVTGGVSLNGAILSLLAVSGITIGDTFTIIDNDGADAVTGTFAGLAEGATLGANGHIFSITYVGGSGNDVELTFTALVPEPGTFLLAALGAVGLLGYVRRRRSR